MKQLLLSAFILVSLASFEQTRVEQLRDIKTLQDAKQLIAKKPLFHGEVSVFNSNRDTSLIQKQLYSKKTGDIITIGKRTYKILYDTTATLLRASYIYLDGTKLSRGGIDSMRDYIMSEYKNGISFNILIKEFNMDGSAGDTNWFADNMMVHPFSLAVANHNLADVFTVDVPANNWYYVVKKTFNSKETTQMTVVSIEE